MSLRLVRQFGVVGLRGAPITGYRKFGVPVGGAFDQESLALANTLAGCTVLAPAWELGMAQATFQAEADGVVSVVGAGCSVRYREWDHNSGCAFAVNAGNEFTVEAPRIGARVYVAWDNVARASGWRMRLNEAPESVAMRNEIRIVPGPHAAMFDLSALGRLLSVSRTGNRVGVRLEGSIGPHSIELSSEPSCVGTIQVSNDGGLIVLGPDGPTIGGYPKIGVVISSDISRVGQLQPGDEIRFTIRTIDEARELGLHAQLALEKRLSLLRIGLSPNRFPDSLTPNPLSHHERGCKSNRQTAP